MRGPLFVIAYKLSLIGPRFEPELHLSNGEAKSQQSQA